MAATTRGRSRRIMNCGCGGCMPVSASRSCPTSCLPGTTIQRGLAARTRTTAWTPSSPPRRNGSRRGTGGNSRKGDPSVIAGTSGLCRQRAMRLEQEGLSIHAFTDVSGRSGSEPCVHSARCAARCWSGIDHLLHQPARYRRPHRRVPGLAWAGGRRGLHPRGLISRGRSARFGFRRCAYEDHVLLVAFERRPAGSTPCDHRGETSCARVMPSRAQKLAAGACRNAPAWRVASGPEEVPVERRSAIRPAYR